MSNNKRKRLLILALLTLAVIGIMIFSILPDNPVNTLSTPLSVILRPLESFFSGFGESVQQYFNAVSHNRQLSADNKMLREENLALRLEIKDNQQAANAYKSLQEAFNLKDYFPDRRFQAANILQEPLEYDYDYYRLDVGTREGLDFEKFAGFAVIDEYAHLAGQVFAADALSSKVLPLFHEGFSCSVYAAHDLAHDFELRGQGLFATAKSLSAVNIPAAAKLAVGDELYTSGLGGIFPEGILCGTVSSISEPDALGFRTAAVEAAVSLEDKQVLFVLLPPEAVPSAVQDAEATGDGSATGGE